MASTYLSKTFSSGDSSGNGQKKFTVSAWVKRASTGSHHDIVSAYKAANGFQCDAIRIYNTDTFGSFSHSDSGGSGYNVRSNAKLRDLNCWYHLVTAVDTTQSTASDRVKLYINGEQVTSLASSTYPAQNESLIFGMPTDAVHEIGAVGTSAYFDGVMSHVHICFNQQYTASAFGETDSTTGEWKIITEPSVSYGDLGGWYLKDAANGTDYSSNSNTYTVNGTLTKTEDNPSNVFATWNPLYNPGGSSYTFSNGNTKFEESGNQWKTTFSTLSAASGKYYAEFKCNGNYMMVGVADMTRTFYGIADRNFASTTYISEQGYGLYNADGSLRYRGSETSYASSYGSGDIVQVALDCDNNRVFFGINGTWQNSADPTNASSGFSMTATNARYAFAVAVQQDQVHANFGNGYFSTTAVASAGTNASGNGIFEYDVPTGYTALSTKGLNL
tara:strand:+ start:156 stop:1490 length:1335 start_codon:yes stop_codon:yes gene_type:complete